MKLEKTMKRLAGATDDCAELRRGARDIGHELPRDRLYFLRRLRGALAGLDDTDVSDFARGYRAALLDLVTAYDSAIENAYGVDLEVVEVDRS